VEVGKLDPRSLADASRPEDVPVDLDELTGARARMQPVDVLRHEREPAASFDLLLEPRERMVCVVGSRVANELAPPLVPLPDEPRIARERLWGGKLFRAVVLPETSGARNVGMPLSARYPRLSGRRRDEGPRSVRSLQSTRSI